MAQLRATLEQYQRWSPNMQSRFRRRYGNDAPGRLRPRTSATPSTPATPQPTPTAPTASAGPPAQPPSFNARYQDNAARINRDVGDVETSITGEEQRIRRQYGIDDTSDPFALARQLQRSLDEGNLATNTSLAAQGQLYAGSMNNALDANRFNFEQANDAMRKEYADRLNALAERRRAARQAAQDALRDNELDRVDATVSERATDPGPEAAATGAAGATPVQKQATASAPMTVAPRQNPPPNPASARPLGQMNSAPPQSSSPAVSRAVWNRWTEAQRDRYRARHRNEWDRYRPR